MIGEKRYREIAGVVTILTSIIVLLSLFTYTKFDYNRLTSNQPVENIIGPLGAYLSHLIRSAFGLSSYLLVIMILQIGKSLFTDGTIKYSLERLFSLMFFMITLSSLIGIFTTENPQSSSGYLGLYIFSFLKGISGSVGAYLVIAIVNLVGLILIGFVSLSATLFNTIKSKEGEIADEVNQIRENISSSKIDFPFFSFETREYKTKKMPWFTKEAISLSTNSDTEDQTVEKNIPLFLGMDVPQKAEAREVFTEINIPQNYESTLEEVYFDSRVENINTSYSDNTVLPESIDLKNKEIDVVSEENYFEDNLVDAKSFHEMEKSDEFEIQNSDEENLKYSEKKSDESKETMNSGIRITGISLSDENNIEETIDAYKIPQKDETQIVDAIPVDKTEEIQASIIEPSTVSEEVNIIETYSSNEINNQENQNSNNSDIPSEFLNLSNPIDSISWETEIKRNSYLLVKTLADFGINSKVIDVNRGPVITLYELEIASGIRVNKVANLSDDIAMALAASRVRILAPIPGKSAVGIEIPNGLRESVTLGDIIGSSEYQKISGILKVVLGKDILGVPVTLDLNKQPHMLIAGATGSGKSVCVNTLISSLIHAYDSDYLKFIMVDPKMVELQLYNGLPHLLTPVITDPVLAPSALKWAIYEMERRYKVLSEVKKRDIASYNKFLDDQKRPSDKLPFIVIIIDELADLMMVAPKEMEGYIARIAQKARAIGIHMVLATQRPSVDIITGIIKANFPARIAFQVAQRTDSRTILDQGGAEKLLGQGDMLYQSPTSSFPTRIQGAFISEEEIEKIVDHFSSFGTPQYIDILESVSKTEELEIEDLGDELFVDAMKIIEETRKASASYLQRRLSIGYNRAAKIIELMEDKGYVGPPQGSKPREVYI